MMVIVSVFVVVGRTVVQSVTVQVGVMVVVTTEHLLQMVVVAGVGQTVLVV